jgi:hypothetical protein
MTDTPENTRLPLFNITSNALPMPPEMFAILGELVVLWSRIEASIDQDTTDTMRRPIVREGVKERPRGFGKRLALWRRSVRRLYPKVPVYQDQATEFKRVAGIVSRFRNHVIHGSWRLQPTENGEFIVTSIKHDMEGADFHKFEVTLEFLRALLDDMRKLDNPKVTLSVRCSAFSTAECCIGSKAISTS